ncbi:MAG: molybdenum cofactor biosynthesis protein MoaE [Anaerolineales bacterium]|nr:molybdenum cofactor biosynthesis protein MoaE [Anaerolineales bacterium]
MSDSNRPMKQITVLFFATLKDRAGTKQTAIDLPVDALVRDLKAQVIEMFPGLAEASGSILVSVNRTYAFDDDFIPADAEVAFFPPVSGGVEPLTIAALTEREIDILGLLQKITTSSTGAACFFTGMVRGVTRRDNPHETVYLEYEAYQPMAEAKMHQIAEEIRHRWPTIEGIAIVQRIGHLEPGAPAVIIACSAAHRDTGVFDAARYGIDRLKEIVPVWKKEVGPQGEEWVEGEYLPTSHD